MLFSSPRYEPYAGTETQAKPAASGRLLPVSLMFILLRLQGTLTNGLLPPGEVGKLLGIPAWNTGLLLKFAYDLGCVRRGKSGDKNVYGLSAYGFSWLQLWVQDFNHTVALQQASQHVTYSQHNTVRLLLEQTSLPWLASTDVTETYRFIEVPSEDVAHPDTSQRLLRYCMHYAAPHQLRLTNSHKREFPEKFWPLWSDQLGLSPATLTKAPNPRF